MSSSVQKVLFCWVIALFFLLASSLRALAWQPPLRTIPKTDLTDVAAAGYDGDEPVIFYNPQYMQWLGSVISPFFFAHEYAHHHLGHLKRLAEVMKKNRYSMIQIRQEYEMEADCYAAGLLAKNAPQAIEAIVTFFEKAQGEGRLDWLHPSGYERAALIRKCAEKAVSGEEKELWEIQAGDPEAAEQVVLSRAETRRAPSQVLFTYRCKNRGRRPVRCSVLISQGDKGDGTAVRRFELTLTPGDVRAVYTGIEAKADDPVPAVSERLFCWFIGPETPEPPKVSAQDFLSFAGLHSGADVSEALAGFGKVSPRPGSLLWYLDYFNGGLSIGFDRATRMVKTVDVFGLEGVEAMRALGIKEPSFNLIGKSREYLQQVTGLQSAPDAESAQFSLNGKGVTITFSCYGEECNRITVEWR